MDQTSEEKREAIVAGAEADRDREACARALRFVERAERISKALGATYHGDPVFLGRIAEESESGDYIGGSDHATHVAQMNTRGSWVHSSAPHWTRAGYAILAAGAVDCIHGRRVYKRCVDCLETERDRLRAELDEHLERDELRRQLAGQLDELNENDARRPEPSGERR